MPLNPLYIQSELPTTSQAALREFNDRYLAAVGASRPNGWADTLGDLVPTDRPETTFPVSQLRSLYRRTEGEQRFKTLRETSFTIETEEFDDGYEAPLLQLFLQVFAYRNWQQAPARLVLAEEQFRHTNMAVILDGSGTRSVTSSGPTNTAGGLGYLCADGQALFSTTHPVNMVDSTVSFSPQYAASSVTQWSNYQSTATNVLGSQASGNTGVFAIDNLTTEIVNMQTAVPDENGILLDVDPDTIVVPADYYQPLLNGLNNTRLAAIVTNGTSNDVAAAAIENIYKGKFNVVKAKEFTLANNSTADWYLVDSKLIKEGVAPWVIMRQTVPQSLALRWYDESTDFFRDTGHIKVSSHIWYGFGLALPHAIRRIKGPTRTSQQIGT